MLSLVGPDGPEAMFVCGDEVSTVTVTKLEAEEELPAASVALAL